MPSDAKLRSNPGHLRIAYVSFFLVQSFDCFLFTSLSHRLFTDRAILTAPTHFFIRANAITLFPFILLVFLLRDQHVSTPIGKRVAMTFTLFHGLALVLITAYKVYGSWALEPFWAGFAFHGAWFASGTAALLGY